MEDTLSFEFDSTHIDAGGNEYYVQDVKFYTSKLTLSNTSGHQTTVRDTTSFLLKDTNTIIDTADRYLLFDESVLEYTSGYFDDNSDFDSLELDLGLDDLAQEIFTDTLVDTHPLKNTEMYDDIAESLVSLRIRVSVVNSQFSSIYRINDLQKVTIPYTITPEITFDTWIELDIDYKILFQNIDFISDNENTISSKLVSNIKEAIRQH